MSRHFPICFSLSYRTGRKQMTSSLPIAAQNTTATEACLKPSMGSSPQALLPLSQHERRPSHRYSTRRFPCST